MTLVKVIVMTIGELNYTTLLVDNLEATNPETKAPLVPYRESSFVFLFPIHLCHAHYPYESFGK